MTVREIYEMIDRIAPFSSQEEWDNSGLLVGSPADSVSGVLFALDVTDPVIGEARSLGASLIVAHHPVMFTPLRKITDEDREGRLISSLIRNGISLIAAHTNLDRVSGGMNDILASRCGLSDISGEDFFRSGLLPEPLRVADYVPRLANALSCTVRVMGSSDRIVRQIGVCSGGGGDYWHSALAAGCDAFVTGEMKHHLALDAADAGIVVFECGHFATEEPGIRALAETLQMSVNRLEYNLRVFVSKIPAYSFSQQP